MTAKYWTTNGEDIWMVKERRVFDFENMDTKEVVTCDNIHDVIDGKFHPVIMPKVKAKQKRKKAKKEKDTKAKSSRRGPKAKSKHKGVRVSGKKFTAQWWDGKKAIHLGSFDSELLAAAAVQEALGSHKEAKRLRNEYEEGDPLVQERPMDE